MARQRTSWRSKCVYLASHVHAASIPPLASSPKSTASHSIEWLTLEPGEKPSNPRLLAAKHVHVLRDTHTHQHTRL